VISLLFYMNYQCMSCITFIHCVIELTSRILHHYCLKNNNNDDNNNNNISVGYVWRRLTAKVACNSNGTTPTWIWSFRGDWGGNQSSSLLPGEHEHGQVVRQSRLPERFQYSAQGRDHVILETVANHLPELLPFATSTLSGPSDLQFGDLNRSRRRSPARGYARPSLGLLLFSNRRTVEVNEVWISPVLP